MVVVVVVIGKVVVVDIGWLRHGYGEVGKRWK